MKMNQLEDGTIEVERLSVGSLKIKTNYKQKETKKAQN